MSFPNRTRHHFLLVAVHRCMDEHVLSMMKIAGQHHQHHLDILENTTAFLADNKLSRGEKRATTIRLLPNVALI